MPILANYFNYGSAVRNENPELNRQLSESYSKTAYAVNSKTSRYVTDGVRFPNVDPPANSDFNKNFELGDLYVRTDTNMAWIMTSRTTSESVTWTVIT